MNNNNNNNNYIYTPLLLLPFFTRHPHHYQIQNEYSILRQLLLPFIIVILVNFSGMLCTYCPFTWLFVSPKAICLTVCLFFYHEDKKQPFILFCTFKYLFCIFKLHHCHLCHHHQQIEDKHTNIPNIITVDPRTKTSAYKPDETFTKKIPRSKSVVLSIWAFSLEMRSSEV